MEDAKLFPCTSLDCLGRVASVCALLTLCMQSMIRLRLIALLSNVAFIMYGWSCRLIPILVLHCMLLLINSTSLIRTLSAKGKPHIRSSRSKADHPSSSRRLNPQRQQHTARSTAVLDQWMMQGKRHTTPSEGAPTLARREVHQRRATKLCRPSHQPLDAFLRARNFPCSVCT
jgi:hypothetical protein